jgi:two-component system, response regulator
MINGPVLLIEDNPDDAELALRSFKKSNLVNPVVVAKDGVEALAYLFGDGTQADDPHRPPPAVILLDLKLPKISGMEVLKRIRESERMKFVPVVILTSSNEQQDLKDCYELGCNSYIRKPVDFKQFAEAVAQLQLYWLVLNEPLPQR